MVEATKYAVECAVEPYRINLPKGEIFGKESPKLSLISVHQAGVWGHAFEFQTDESPADDRLVLLS